MKVHPFSRAHGALLAAALATTVAACGPASGRPTADMSVRGDPVPPGISSTSTQTTTAGTILHINGRFGAVSELEVLIDEQPAQLLPESTSSQLQVRVPTTIAATAPTVAVTVYSSDEMWSARATLPAASSR
jgi:hypothetical protein